MQIKKSGGLQNTLKWVINHIQYLHVFPVTTMLLLWIDMKNSSFKKISVAESMFPFTEASSILGKSCFVIQSYSCFFSLPPSLSFFLQCFSAARHLSQMLSMSPHISSKSKTRTSKSAPPSAINTAAIPEAAAAAAAARISPPVSQRHSGLNCQATTLHSSLTGSAH